MKRNHIIFIKDILESIESIEKFTQGFDYETFRNDDKTISAVVRKLEIIGEATKNRPQKIYLKILNKNIQNLIGAGWQE